MSARTAAGAEGAEPAEAPCCGWPSTTVAVCTAWSSMVAMLRAVELQVPRKGEVLRYQSKSSAVVNRVLQCTVGSSVVVGEVDRK